MKEPLAPLFALVGLFVLFFFCPYDVPRATSAPKPPAGWDVKTSGSCCGDNSCAVYGHHHV